VIHPSTMEKGTISRHIGKGGLGRNWKKQTSQVTAAGQISPQMETEKGKTKSGGGIVSRNQGGSCAGTDRGGKNEN